MLTKKVKNRIFYLILFISSLAIIIFYLAKTLNNNLLFFKTPSDLIESQNTKIGKNIRLGGMVKKDSIIASSDEIKFIITDFKNEIFVSYKGAVPNLFLEEKGVIAEGFLQDKKYFIANRVLAKHDENYMPPELKEAIQNAK